MDLRLGECLVKQATTPDAAVMRPASAMAPDVVMPVRAMVCAIRGSAGRMWALGSDVCTIDPLNRPGALILHDMCRISY